MKRKEARKRKIEVQNGERLLETSVKLYSEGTSADELAKKTSEQALPPSPLSENISNTENDNAVGKVAVVDEPTYQGKDESLTRRPQRFIVFIGPSTPFNIAWLRRLMPQCQNQAIYLIQQRMSQ